MIRRRIEIENTERKQKETRLFNRRLKLTLLALTFIGILVSTFLFWNTWTKQNQLIETRLETFTELRHSVINRFLTSLAGETLLWSKDQKIIETAQSYIDIWDTLSLAERDYIREIYLNGKAADKVLGSDSAYHDLHAETHPNLKAFEAHHGYYDIFFFNLQGDLVYSVEKEADYGLNFANNGNIYADSGLGKAFQQAVLQEPDQPAVFIDFSNYAPSNDDPAAFLASPMIDKSGEKMGVYAIQVPISKFNAVMQYSSGLGSTGETYIVGPDYLMRSQSRLTKTDGVLKQSVKTDAVKQVLTGKTILTRGKNFAGKKTVISGIPLEFNKTNWAVITEMEISELQSPLRNYVIFYGLSILFILVFSLLSYWILFARKVKSEATPAKKSDLI